MPKRDPDLLIEDMLAAARKISRYTSGMEKEVFRQEEMAVDAVVRNLEILGEAVRQLPKISLLCTRRYPGGRSRDCATGSYTTISVWIST